MIQVSIASTFLISHHLVGVWYDNSAAVPHGLSLLYMNCQLIQMLVTAISTPVCAAEIFVYATQTETV